VPGSSAKSPLYLRITGQQQSAMPLGGKLSPEAIAIIQKWLDSGAAWDGNVSSAAPATSNAPGADKRFTEQERNWWAFKKPVHADAPNIKAARRTTNPIDAFVKKALDDKGLEPAPRADRRTLIRRAYLDLVGLLPPVEEVDAFVNDPSA